MTHQRQNVETIVATTFTMLLFSRNVRKHMGRKSIRMTTGRCCLCRAGVRTHEAQRSTASLARQRMHGPLARLDSALVDVCINLRASIQHGSRLRKAKQEGAMGGSSAEVTEKRFGTTAYASPARHAERN